MRQPRWRSISAWRAVAALLVLAGQQLVAQCPLQWQPGAGIPGVDGSVRCSTNWDPDGAGPLPERLVIGGEFTIAGAVRVQNIAAYDPASQSWSPLVWLSFPVDAVVASAGALYVAGLQVGFGLYGRVMRWTGTGWQQVGATFDDRVSALAVMPNGDLIAAGDFDHVGSTQAHGLARWNGTVWQSMGDLAWSSPYGPAIGFAADLAVLPNGDLVVCGLFDSIGVNYLEYAALWNGSMWSQLGVGVFRYVWDVEVLANGTLVALGTPQVGLPQAMMWSGTNWLPLGAALPPLPSGLKALANGDLLAYGSFGFATFDGATWSHDPPWQVAEVWPVPFEIFEATTMANGDLYVSGTFVRANGVDAWRVARWDGAQWQALNRGTTDTVDAIAAVPDGSFVVGGRFTTIGGLAAAHIARFDGVNWMPIGNGSLMPVSDLVARPDGEVIALGRFDVLGSAFGSPVVRIQGMTATPLPGGTFWDQCSPTALGVQDDGDVLIACRQHTTPTVVLARWDGSSLTSTTLGLTGETHAVTTAANGDVVLGGDLRDALTGANRFVARWDGTSVQPLGAGTNGPVHALVRMPNGDLVAGLGPVSPGPFLVRWNGASWLPVGGFPGAAVRSLQLLPDGDLLVGTGSLLRWDGASWSDYGTGGPVHAIAVSRQGTVAVGGDFLDVGYWPVSAYFGRLPSPCPAAEVSYGLGCAGSAGVLALRADVLPWLGGTMRSSIANLPNNSLVVPLLGFAQASLPLHTVLPQALPGCRLLTTSDVVLPPQLASGGALVLLSIPNAPALIGQVFYQQAAAVGVNPLGQIATVTSSNGLALTIGSL